MKFTVCDVGERTLTFLMIEDDTVKFTICYDLVNDNEFEENGSGLNYKEYKKTMKKFATHGLAKSMMILTNKHFAQFIGDFVLNPTCLIEKQFVEKKRGRFSNDTSGEDNCRVEGMVHAYMTQLGWQTKSLRMLDARRKFKLMADTRPQRKKLSLKFAHLMIDSGHLKCETKEIEDKIKTIHHFADCVVLYFYNKEMKK